MVYGEEREGSFAFKGEMEALVFIGSMNLGFNLEN